MKLAAVFVVAFACFGAFASEPGQPLDCSDWVYSESGHSCSVALADCGAEWGWCAGNDLAIDNHGWIYQVQQVQAGTCPGSGWQRHRTQILRLKSGTVELLAYVDDRCHPNGNIDVIRPVGSNSLNPNSNRITFDSVGGRLLIPLASECISVVSQCPWTGTRNWLGSIEGLTTTFEVLQTFTPQPSLGFRVPYMPEGMAGADHFDTYWGPLTNPIDFTHAQSLACDYPTTPPAVGDYLTVADTIPTPAPGQGLYYITAATYQGQTRYGRKTTAGQLSGRDPALLPVCVQPQRDRTE